MFRSDHYHTGNSWGIHTGDMARLEDGVFGYIRNLKRTGYPFPVIAVQYSGYLTDNSPPSMRECDLIRAWNERYAWPKLRSATAHEFLGRIDSQYGDKLPVYRAAYPDWWTDGFGSAARETAASRKTQSDLVAIEAMLSMAQMEGTGQSGGTHEELRRIHETCSSTTSTPSGPRKASGTPDARILRYSGPKRAPTYGRHSKAPNCSMKMP